MQSQDPDHVPVLLRETLELLDVQPGDVVVDCTLGLAGHARSLAQAAGPEGLLVGLDVDERNLATASDRLRDCGCPFRLFQSNFERIDEVLAEAGGQAPGGALAANVVLVDLGISSSQLDDAQRGFSFQKEGPLDMRLDPRLSTTAADLVNRLGETELADLIYHHGQERHSRRIAQAIHRARRQHRITTTSELVRIVSRAQGVDPTSRASKIHPATKTFQALRIAVNNELGALKTLLEKAPSVLRPGARLGIISFHSLEDALVKRDFLARKGQGIYQILTKKPVTPESDERQSNPRSRSAKLRVAART